ncbi:MAG TPA: sigma 54-interacting transcriptional regulator, partial [Thermoanaerobaculia bacterium]|nr:sigma 54-interacting transcriptional regulator [Thermoanaerobaculia bacterium]
VEMIVCTPRPAAADRDVLRDCGASELVTPASWTDGAMAERVLAELILRGDIQPTSFGVFRGATLGMQRIYEEITTLAPLSEPILIRGETGTGKELVAREIHQRSGRSGAITAINVAALTAELIGSELFGHERGSFTGATAQRQGLLAEAGAGTVFLDEIGDLDLASQAKVLRVLEEGMVRPVGSNRWQRIHARIVLATHRDLDEDCADGRFRQDLYERIRGFTLHLPPLRERRADLVLLAHHFVTEFNQAYPGERFIPSGALDPLFRYDWPGNVRELRQVIRQAAAYAIKPSGAISAVRLQEAVFGRHTGSSAGSTVRFDPTAETWREVHDRTQAQYFRAILAQAGGNKAIAAERAGYKKSQFYEILRQIEKRLLDES